MKAKKKSKKKVVSKKDKVNLNSLIRFYEKRILLATINDISELDYHEDFIRQLFNVIRDFTNSLEMNEYKEIFNHDVFVKIISCIEDCVMMYRMGLYSDDNFAKMKEEILEYMSVNKLGLETFISIFLTNNIMKRNSVFTVIGADFFEEVRRAIDSLTLHLLTYVVKIKNNNMLMLDICEDNKFNIVYGNDILCTEEGMNVVSNFLTKKYQVSKKEEGLFASTLTSMIDIPDVLCKLYLNRNLSSDFIDGSQIDYFFVDNFEDTFPLKNDGSWSISSDDLEKLPDNRLYATPKNGIRFEFLDKSKNIDHIDMVEDRKAIYFKVAVFNNNNMYKNFRDTTFELESISSGALDDKVDLESHYAELALNTIKAADRNRIRLEDRIIELSFVFDKEKYSKIYNKDKDYFYMQSTGFTFSKCTSTQKYLENLENIILSCLYMAYYNPGLCSNEVVLRNIEKCKYSKYTKTETYRVAHLRKLPVGSTLSPQAIKNAIKEGFDYIPDGYTFVSASNIHLSKSKVIEII